MRPCLLQAAPRLRSATTCAPCTMLLLLMFTAPTKEQEDLRQCPLFDEQGVRFGSRLAARGVPACPQVSGEQAIPLRKGEEEHSTGRAPATDPGGPRRSCQRELNWPRGHDDRIVVTQITISPPRQMASCTVSSRLCLALWS
jgi:hypothetical protein